jgi:hypothetical protein
VPRILAPGETATFNSSEGIIASRVENNQNYFLIWVYGMPQTGGSPLSWGRTGNALRGLTGVEWTTQEYNGIVRHVAVSLR